jgi:hypothetical protein
MMSPLSWKRKPTFIPETRRQLAHQCRYSCSCGGVYCIDSVLRLSYIARRGDGTYFFADDFNELHEQNPIRTRTARRARCTLRSPAQKWQSLGLVSELLGVKAKTFIALFDRLDIHTAIALNRRMGPATIERILAAQCYIRHGLGDVTLTRKF